MLLRGEVFFIGPLSPVDHPGLDDEEDAVDVLQDDADAAEAEGPRQKVVLPIWHVVAVIAICPEDDQGDCAEGRYRKKT